VPSHPAGLGAGERFYGWLLRLYPAEFRQAYEAPMRQLFRDMQREARQAGSLRARLGLWRLVLGELAGTLAREHVDALRRLKMDKRQTNGRLSPAATMGMLAGCALIALGLLGSVIVRETGGPLAAAVGLSVIAHVAAAAIMDYVLGSRGLVLGLIGLILAGTFLPAAWVGDAAAHLREDPILGAPLIIAAAVWYRADRPRWPLWLAAGILASGPILASLI
jgi:hypothetical protein